MKVWNPKIDEEYNFKRELRNQTNENAVAVVKTTTTQESCGCAHPNEVSANMDVVGRIPKVMVVWATKFLKRQTNTGKGIIKGKPINRGAAYSLELPCAYVFRGGHFSCDWLRNKLAEENFDVELQ